MYTPSELSSMKYGLQTQIHLNAFLLQKLLFQDPVRYYYKRKSPCENTGTACNLSLTILVLQAKCLLQNTGHTADSSFQKNRRGSSLKVLVTFSTWTRHSRFTQTPLVHGVAHVTDCELYRYLLITNKELYYSLFALRQKRQHTRLFFEAVLRSKNLLNTTQRKSHIFRTRWVLFVQQISFKSK